jgi:hypothetical protein
MRIAYEDKKLGGKTLDLIIQANEILEEYADQGYVLTIRQLYYQFVARGLLPSSQQSYKSVQTIVGKGRLNGYIDWDHIEDRTRNVQSIQHWGSPADIIEATARSFAVDKWADQDEYCEVWIEKDALVGVITRICDELDVPYFSCRGYASLSEKWSAGGQRLLEKIVQGKHVTILHMGDHDPSGLDMTRDLRDRLGQFIWMDYCRAQIRAYERDGKVWKALSDLNRAMTMKGWKDEAMRRFHVQRIALTWDQVQEYNPPPFWAKETDSRSPAYVEEYGNESWELDALDPPTMEALIREHVENLIADDGRWDAAREREDKGQKLLRQASERWEEIVDGLNGTEPEDKE